MPPDAMPTRFLRAETEPLASYSQRRALHIVAVRNYLAMVPFGARLPPVTKLMDALGISKLAVAAALRHLDLQGEIVCTPRGPRRRLRPGEQHPLDAALDQTVREGIRAGTHRPGEALPIGLVAQRHGMSITAIPRALRVVIRDGLVTHRAGPAGRCYYVRDPRDTALDQTRASR